MTEEYPTAAFWLLLIGGILELIGVVPYVLLMALAGGGIFFGFYGWILIVCGIWFLIWAILMIIAAVWVKTGETEEVHKGAVLGLIASILGGINIFALIGAILAFSWKKKAPMIIAPPPPPSI